MNRIIMKPIDFSMLVIGIAIIGILVMISGLYIGNTNIGILGLSMATLLPFALCFIITTKTNQQLEKRN